MTPEELRAQLLAAAERAAVPEIDTERVRTRVRRRRGVRYAAMAGAGLAVVTAVVLNTLPSGSAPDTRTPAGSPHRQPPASGGPGPGDSSPGAPPVPRYGCGQKVTAGPGRGTVTVRVSEVRGAPDGAPRAGYTVTATAPTVLAGEPRLLVLREGRVVAGQGEGTARRTTVAPHRPHHVVAPVPGRPCAGTTWSSVWEGGYELAVVLTPEPGASGGAGGSGAPIVARVPLRTAG
ncbi:hypothetical protein [Streptomyces collinus]|uniref:hypothetical protein n=1 Tax=Streptomyces collinus TaxID=42684 RepID=UPI0033226A32